MLSREETMIARKAYIAGALSALKTEATVDFNFWRQRAAQEFPLPRVPRVVTFELKDDPADYLHVACVDGELRYRFTNVPPERCADKPDQWRTVVSGLHTEPRYTIPLFGKFLEAYRSLIENPLTEDTEDATR